MVNTSIALNMVRGEYFVGEDVTPNSIANSTSETELLEYVIPANTIANGIKIRIGIAGVSNSMGRIVTFRIKIGADGSETTRMTRILRVGDTAEGGEANADVEYVFDDVDWSSEQSVSITAENSTVNTDNIGYADYLNISGY